MSCTDAAVITITIALALSVAALCFGAWLNRWVHGPTDDNLSERPNG